MTETDFRVVMDSIARTWTGGDADAAAALFHQNAVYEEPPRQQYYRGQEAILKFFRAVMSGGVPLIMKWRNLAFNERAEIGFGEYTFARLKQFHGIVAVRFRDGKILQWREYQYQSDLDWERFAGDSRFESADL